MSDSRLETVRRAVDRALGAVVVLAMAVLVLDVLWQVFSRFVLRDPSTVTEELARYLMIWVGLLGAAFAAGRRMHLAVDLLPKRLHGTARLRLERGIELAGVAFGLMMVLGGGRLVWVMLYLGQTSAALEIPLGYVYLAVPLCGSLIAFYSLVHFLSAR